MSSSSFPEQIQRYIQENCNVGGAARYTDQACYSILDIGNKLDSGETVYEEAAQYAVDYCLNTKNLNLFLGDGIGQSVETIIPLSPLSGPSNRWSMINYPFFYSKTCQSDLSNLYLLTSSIAVSQITTAEIKNFCSRYPIFANGDDKNSPLNSYAVSPYSKILSLKNFKFDRSAPNDFRQAVRYNLLGGGTLENSSQALKDFKSATGSINTPYSNVIGIVLTPTTSQPPVPANNPPSALQVYANDGRLYLRKSNSNLLQPPQNLISYYEFLISYFRSENKNNKVLGPSLRFMIRSDERDRFVSASEINPNASLLANGGITTKPDSEPLFGYLTGYITDIDELADEYASFKISEVYTSFPRTLQTNFGCINYPKNYNFGTQHCNSNDQTPLQDPSNGFFWHEIPDPTVSTSPYYQNDGVNFIFDIYGFFENDNSTLYYSTDGSNSFLKNSRPSSATYSSLDLEGKPKTYTINNLFPDFDGEVPLNNYDTSLQEIYDLCTCNLDEGIVDIYKNYYNSLVKSLTPGTTVYGQITQDVNTSGTATYQCIFPKCSISPYPSSDIVDRTTRNNKCKDINCIQIINITNDGTFVGNFNADNTCSDNTGGGGDNSDVQKEIDTVIISFSVVIAIIVFIGIVIAIVLFFTKRKVSPVPASTASALFKNSASAALSKAVKK